MRPPRKRRNSTETTLQIHGVRALKLAIPARAGFVFHVPNQGKRSAVAGKILKDMGLVPGLPDLVLVAVPADGSPSRIAFLELKEQEDGALSSSQRAFRETCRTLGIPWGEARSLSEILEFAREFYAAAGWSLSLRVL